MKIKVPLLIYLLCCFCYDKYQDLLLTARRPPLSPPNVFRSHTAPIYTVFAAYDHRLKFVFYAQNHPIKHLGTMP